MSRSEMSAADRRILASLPADHLDTARVVRDQIAFDAAVSRQLAEREVVRGVRLRSDPALVAARLAGYRAQHASCIASAAAARRACGRLGVARLPG